jgi:hypothetical protein
VFQAPTYAEPQQVVLQAPTYAEQQQVVFQTPTYPEQQQVVFQTPTYPEEQQVVFQTPTYPEQQQVVFQTPTYAVPQQVVFQTPMYAAPQQVVFQTPTYAAPQMFTPQQAVYQAPQDSVTVSLSGDTGEEKVRIGLQNAAGTIAWYEKGAAILLSNTPTSFTLRTLDSLDRAALVIQYTNDGTSQGKKDRNVRMSKSLLINGVESWNPGRIRDFNNFGARGDAVRRKYVEDGFFVWGGQYEIDVSPFIVSRTAK